MNNNLSVPIALWLVHLHTVQLRLRRPEFDFHFEESFADSAPLSPPSAFLLSLYCPISIKSIKSA